MRQERSNRICSSKTKAISELLGSMYVVQAYTCAELIPIANLYEYRSSWQRPPGRNVLLMSIINSCVDAHQFAIGISCLGVGYK